MVVLKVIGRETNGRLMLQSNFTIKAKTPYKLTLAQMLGKGLVWFPFVFWFIIDICEVTVSVTLPCHS